MAVPHTLAGYSTLPVRMDTDVREADGVCKAGARSVERKHTQHLGDGHVAYLAFSISLASPLFLSNSQLTITKQRHGPVVCNYISSSGAAFLSVVSLLCQRTVNMIH